MGGEQGQVTDPASSTAGPPLDPGFRTAQGPGQQRLSMAPSSPEFPLFSYNNGVVMTSCRELDNNRSALSAASAFAIATAGANEGTPNKEKYRRMSLASAGAWHLHS